MKTRLPRETRPFAAAHRCSGFQMRTSGSTWNRFIRLYGLSASRACYTSCGHEWLYAIAQRPLGISQVILGLLLYYPHS